MAKTAMEAAFWYCGVHWYRTGDEIKSYQLVAFQ